MADISLSKAVRSNLLSLQTTATMMAKTQDRLSTGNKVNSALDNPTNFFTASGLNSRASDLNNLMDSMSNSVKTIEAANNGITSITKLVEAAQSSVRQALSDAASKTKPTITSTTALATAAEATTYGKTLQQTMADKLLVGSTTAATATSAGSLNFAAADKMTVTVGTKTVTYAATATSTVQDFVNAVNASGFASAEISETGNVVLKSLGSETLKVSDTTVAATPAGLTKLGFVVADQTTGTVSTGVSSEVRAKLASQFTEIRSQISSLSKDAGYNGINLLDGDKLTVLFNEKTGTSQAKLDVAGTKLDATSLGILASGSGAGTIDFQNDTSLNTAVDSLKTTLTTLRTTASDLGSKLSIVQTRQDFTKATINTLQTGAANLTLADMNEEAANMLALQTRQSLAQSTLSMASQADQGILQLLR